MVASRNWQSTRSDRRANASALLGAGAVSLTLLACAAPEESVRPGINDSYLSEDLDIDEMVARFETESREIAAERASITAAIGLRPGQSVADIGAGTGLFLEPLATAVGAGGKVYAVDIAPAMVAHLRGRAAEMRNANVEVVHCTERSAELPTASVDAVFLCDTYHHFEYPRSTLASIRAALRPGGDLVIVDFERIPGVSREWVLNHVRAGKQEVIAELAAAGFDFVEEIEIDGLVENYFVRFRRR